MREFNTRTTKGDYSITFETDDRKAFEQVQTLCEILIDGKDGDAMPTVEAIEVVRCKDCKWWKTNYMWNGSERKVCVIEAYEPVRNDDDYCSKGERK